MIANETKFWHMLRDRIFKGQGKFSRIESHSTSIGVPDVHYSSNEHTGWIELKYANSWDGELVLRPAQYQWMKRTLAQGVTNLFVMALIAEPDQILMVRVTNQTLEIMKGSVDPCEWYNVAGVAVCTNALRNKDTIIGELTCRTI